MVTLVELLKDLQKSFGFEYQLRLRALRDYLRRNPADKICQEIKEIEDPDLLRILWSAGLRKPLYDCALEQITKIIRKRGVR